jgi:hypothetical protein
VKLSLNQTGCLIGAPSSICALISATNSNAVQSITNVHAHTVANFSMCDQALNWGFSDTLVYDGVF